MNWNIRIRQFHRWTSIAFVAVVLAIFVMLGVGAQPASWVYLLPLLPLALLSLTGVYLFALPYVARRSGGGRATTA